MLARRILCLLIGLLASVVPVLARELTFGQRVEAQRAIERVYYAYQVGVTQPFEQAVPTAALERKVRTYLAQSAALERLWSTPVTAKMLQRELERMAQGTRLPERLGQLYAALGYDSFLVQECLARAALVDRLSRDRFSYSPTIHAESRKEAEGLWAQVATGKRNASLTHHRRWLMDLAQVDQEVDAASPRNLPTGGAEGVRRVELSPEDFGEQRKRFPGKPGEVGRLLDEREAYVFRVVLDEKPGEARVATFTVPKTPWAEWWESVRGTFDEAAVMPVASENQTLPTVRQASGGALPLSTCQPDDTWDNGVLDDSPGPATLHTAVWTGSRMIVWGGTLYHTGSSYDPVTDSWTPVSTTGAPTPRLYHTAVWTGSRMIVWGGTDYLNSMTLDTGGLYDPLTDSWTPASTTSVPSHRRDHVAVWTGSRMIVWGGNDGASSLNTGGLYDPATDSWMPISMTGVPLPRQEPTAVWTGSRMIVWGGYNGSAVVNTGGVYDPLTNSWSSTSSTGVPSPRHHHTAVWTGSRMVVWGGAPAFGTLDTGGVYDPGSNSWVATSTVGAPSSRSGHAAVWTGGRMVVWGGGSEYDDYHPTKLYDTGGLFDPSTNTWTATSTTGAPSKRYEHTAIWTGSRMIVWGGRNAFYDPINTGGLYDPLTNGWAPTSTASAPSPRFKHTAVWTGSRMIVWGGSDYYFEFSTGGVYDAVTDSWTATSTIGAPAPRSWHTAVWTGSRMIVWGGHGNSLVDIDTGGLYDPLTDTWAATSMTGAPPPRLLHTAVWTGSRMIVWGGSSYITNADLDTGGLYDPLTNSWTPTSTIGAPSARSRHSAIWTGSRMIVWGGYLGSGSGLSAFDTGGVYDPATDGWTPTSTTNAPVSRVYHTAVWSGSRMIVWGGSHNPGSINTGGSYDPDTDGWTATSTAGAPSPRTSHTAVWSGTRMIIWGGYDGHFANTGAVYDPVTDGWTPTSMTGAPSPRGSHTAVATDGGMIVWGGLLGNQLSTGGRYVLGGFVDTDGDGFGVCSAACSGTPSCGDDCPIAYNPGQEDADLDGAGDACDCAPQDPLDGPPVEVGDTLTMAKAGGLTVLSWSDGGIAGPFRLYRGWLDAGNAWVYDHACVGEAIAGTSVGQSLEPQPSSLFYYLITRQACGESVPGRDSAGEPIPEGDPCSAAAAS